MRRFLSLRQRLEPHLTRIWIRGPKLKAHLFHVSPKDLLFAWALFEDLPPLEMLQTAEQPQ